MPKIVTKDIVHSPTKIALATTLSLTLLVGGSTYALWSVNAPLNSAATITTGDLNVTAASAQQWSDISTPATPVTIPSLSGFAMVPGDTIQLKQDFNVVIIGNNISGKLKILVPNDSDSPAILAQAVFTLRLLDKDGVELGSITPTLNTAHSLEVDVANLPHTTSAGELYSAELTVALPEISDNTTKLQVATLANLIITLDQGGVYVAPPTIETLAATPAITGVPYSLALAGHGVQASYTISAGALPDGLKLDANTGVISGTPTTAGAANFTVKKTNVGGSVTQALTITVAIPAPTITTTATPAATWGVLYSVALAGTGDDVTYAVTTGSLPDGLSLDSATGVISGTPTAVAITNFTVTATNSGGEASQALSIGVAYALPTITTDTLDSGVIGTTYSASLAGTGEAVTYSISSGSLPAGLTMGSNTGTISGNPTTAGSKTFTVTKTNSTGSVAQELTINVAIAAPKITTTTLANGIKGTAYTGQIAGTGTSVTYAVTAGALPAGLSMTSAGAITGTPTAAATANFTVTATNAGGTSAQALSIIIRLAAPTLNASTLAGATKGTAYTGTVVGTGEAVSYAVTSGALPGGISLNASTGALSGNPTTAGTFNFTVTATNTGGNASNAYSIVTKIAVPIITTTSVGTATKGTAYSATVAVTGESITYSISSGALPAGLVISSTTGTISGTATGTAGTVSFTVKATNSSGSDTQALSIVVKYALPTITTTSAAKATIGVAYSQALAGTGEAVTYTISSGALPAGLTINSSTGTISGQSTTVGSKTFTVSKTNSTGADTQSLTIVTAIAAPTITTPTDTYGYWYSTGAKSYSLKYTGTGVTFSIASGRLAAGLTLNTSTGVISGKATTYADNPSVTIKVTNSSGSATTASFFTGDGQLDM